MIGNVINQKRDGKEHGNPTNQLDEPLNLPVDGRRLPPILDIVKKQVRSVRKSHTAERPRRLIPLQADGP